MKNYNKNIIQTPVFAPFRAKANKKFLITNCQLGANKNDVHTLVTRNYKKICNLINYIKKNEEIRKIKSAEICKHKC